MLFVLEGRDKPGALEIRLAVRPAHLEYLKALGDDLVLAGPFIDDMGQPCGSMVVIKAADMAAAQKFAAADPYMQANLFASTEVRQWVWALNTPEGM